MVITPPTSDERGNAVVPSAATHTEFISGARTAPYNEFLVAEALKP